MIIKWKHKFHVCTVSHAAAPWRWNKLYPDEWLQYVNEKHTHYTVELRDSDGSFLTQSDLIPAAHHHPVRDLAVFHLEREAEIVEHLKSIGLETRLELAKEDEMSEEHSKEVSTICILIRTY